MVLRCLRWRGLESATSNNYVCCLAFPWVKQNQSHFDGDIGLMRLLLHTCPHKHIPLHLCAIVWTLLYILVFASIPIYDPLSKRGLRRHICEAITCGSQRISLWYTMNLWQMQWGNGVKGLYGLGPFSMLLRPPHSILDTCHQYLIIWMVSKYVHKPLLNVEYWALF